MFFKKKVEKNLVVREFCRIFVVLIYYALWLSIIFNPKKRKQQGIRLC